MKDIFQSLIFSPTHRVILYPILSIFIFVVFFFISSRQSSTHTPYKTHIHLHSHLHTRLGPLAQTSFVYINLFHPQNFFCFNSQSFSSHQAFIYIFLIFYTSDLFHSLLAIISSFSSIGSSSNYFIKILLTWLSISLIGFILINWLTNHCFSSTGLQIIIFHHLA